MRFPRGRRAVVFGLAFVFAVVGCLPARAQDWPQFRGNPQLTGVTEAVLPVSLKLLWTYEAGEAIESSAAIVGGSVYVLSLIHI